MGEAFEKYQALSARYEKLKSDMDRTDGRIEQLRNDLKEEGLSTPKETLAFLDRSRKELLTITLEVKEQLDVAEEIIREITGND